MNLYSNILRLASVLGIVLVVAWHPAPAQDNAAKCTRIPRGNWSVKFQQFKGPGSESTPYQIISMSLEACDGYLYLSNLQLLPRERPFFTIELSAFVYHAEDPATLIAQEKVFGLGNGDGDFDSTGYWRTPLNKRWGTPLGTGSQPLLERWIKNGKLDGDYIVAVGITLISFTDREVWHLYPPADLKDRNKALLDAAGNDNTRQIELLMASGADVNARGAGGETPLIRAAKYGRSKSVALLLSFGADVNAQSTQGYTAIRLASQYGYFETVEALLKARANFQIKDKDGEDALLAAAFENRGRVWDMLKAAGAQVESAGEEMVCAAGLGNIAKLQKLIDNGVDVNSTGPRQTSGLQLAVLNGHTEVVKLLLSHHVDVNGTDQWGRTALREAFFRRNRELINELVAKGANVNLKDVYGMTALMDAARGRNLEEAKLLLELGADPNLIDNDGKTALDYAVERANRGPVSENDPIVVLLKANARQTKP